MNKRIFLSIIVVLSLFILNACGRDRQTESLTVHFDTQGGSQVDSFTIKDASDIDDFKSPEKEGYRFIGWTDNLSTQTVFSSSSIDWNKNELTLYALWEQITYEISFMTRGGNPIETLSFPYQAEINLPIPTNDLEVSFLGWYLDSSLSTPFNETFMPAEDLVLYAKWSEPAFTEKNTFYFEIVSQTNNELELNIYVDGNDVRFIGYDIEIAYDETVLDFVDYHNHLSNTVNDSKDGVISFNYVDALNPIETQHVIMTLHFTINSSTSSQIEINIIDIIDIDETYQIFSTEAIGIDLFLEN